MTTTWRFCPFRAVKVGLNFEATPNFIWLDYIGVEAEVGTLKTRDWKTRDLKSMESAHSTSVCDTHTDSDSETSADDADASTNAVVATVSTPAVDSNDCEVCLITQRDERIALLPCGHRRFCETCTNEVEHQGRGCPICRTDIQMIMRLF